MNAEDIIDKNRESLVENIEVRITTLWEKLIELELFKSTDVDYIRVSHTCNVLFSNL